MALTPEQQQAVDIALERGNKIQAIKIYRGATGSGLAGAKEAVEERLAELGKADPDRYPPRQPSGCLGILIALAGIAALAGAALLRLA
jgi:hypothetical protein